MCVEDLTVFLAENTMITILLSDCSLVELCGS